MYNDNLKLNEMIDINSKPVKVLACHLNMKNDELFEILSADYESAQENGRVITDNDGISFETKYASISLKKNSDYCSPYMYY